MSSSSTSPISPAEKALLDHSQHVQQVDESVFLGIQIAGGHILLPILVLTIIFSRKVTRHPVFVNFCISWIFSSVVYSLLVYQGRSSNDLLSLNPSYNSCLVQAALIYGSQALTACTNLALVVHLWIVLRSFAKSKNVSFLEENKWGMVYTCTSNIGILAFASKRAALKTVPRGTGWLALFLRVVLFSVYRILALSLNLAIILHPDEILLVGISKDNIFNGVIDYVQAAIPLVAFLAFATEKAGESLIIMNQDLIYMLAPRTF
ncbi:hypothetical protein DFH11DRAFT_1541094 [Phellopilus nigrolimitatus]|nr:hypothetical protein DFH11DRAFT_1541094 [Phellopilus nigrolimitatus]